MGADQRAILPANDRHNRRRAVVAAADAHHFVADAHDVAGGKAGRRRDDNRGIPHRTTCRECRVYETHDQHLIANCGIIEATPHSISSRDGNWSLCKLYCSTHRIEIFASASLTRRALAPGRSRGKSTTTNANAPGLKIRDCLLAVAAIVALTVPVAPLNVTAVSFAGDAVTVWSWPLVMMGGEIGSAHVLEPEMSAVMTNCWRSPVSVNATGLTLLTPTRVNISPFLKAYVPRPSMLSVEPVCDPRFTSGVELVNVPVVCVGRSGSQYHSSTPSAAPLNAPERNVLPMKFWGLNSAKFAARSLLCAFGSSTAMSSSGTPRLRSTAIPSV